MLWTEISSGDCLSGYNLFDFINWLLLLIVTVWPALFIAFGCLCCICCAPCIYKTANEYLTTQRNAQRERRGVIDAIVQRRYNREDFKEQEQCAICMCDFTEDDEVTPLPCNTAHYFHSACITPWFQTNTTCPLCRKDIDVAGFEQL